MTHCGLRVQSLLQVWLRTIMNATELHALRNMLDSHGVIFTYSGYVTEKVLSSVGDAIKQRMIMESADRKTARNVFSVFVEQMQNIIRYSAEKSEPAPDDDATKMLSYGILAVGENSEEEYFVHAGNLVKKADVDRLQEKLGSLQKMSREELKAAYKEQLKAGPDEHSIGAGLGFIEIARRASTPIDFEFTNVDDKFAFFALRAFI